MKRYITAIVMAWIVFIGIDFLFHAGIFASIWKEDLAVLKSTMDLTILIPVGYISFLLLTMLIGYLFFKIFIIKPPFREVFRFGLIFGILFSLSNFLGLFSYVAIPLKQLLIFNLVSLIEILSVTLSLYFTFFAINLKRVIWLTTFTFILLLTSGIVIQNIL